MNERFGGLLFLVTLALAASLMGASFAGPYLVRYFRQPPDVLLLFGGDMTVRRTAFASALGLCVTAFVFFRPGLAKKRKTPKDPPVNMTGA
jgi:hypothetical protein